jgi:hypothetical protein
MTDEIEKTPSIGISYQLTLQNDKRQLVMQSFVERDCSKEQLNDLLDKMRHAGERQQAWSMIEDFKRAIEQEHINAEQHQIRIEKTDANLKAEWANGSRRGEVRLSPSQIQKQREAYDIAEAIKGRIERLNKDKTEWEQKLANL